MSKEPGFIELTPEQRFEVRARLETFSPTADDCNLMCSIMDSYEAIRDAYVNKTMAVENLLKLLFGPTSEKAKDLFGKKGNGGDEKGASAGDAATGSGTAEKQDEGKRKKKKGKGHGRRGAKALTGAQREFVPHAEFNNGDPCPDCPGGKVYEQKDPGILVRFTGQAPIMATVWELQKYRCNLCGKVFTATPPQRAGTEKYDAASGAMLCCMKYGAGMPFYRLDKLQDALGLPLPMSTQWELAEGVADKVHPAFREIERQAAQMGLHHNDDTNMRILSLMKENKEMADSEEGPSRRGIFTSTVVSVEGDRKIALFFTGRKHAGENLDRVLKHRARGRHPPLQMCDALSRNLPKNAETVEANCMDHARRKVVEVSSNFPDKCQHVIETLGEVYHNDAVAKERNLSPEARLRLHQERSAPVMDGLKAWMTEQFDEKKVEPNSGLGKAFRYMLKRWDKLTLFLRLPGVPLANHLAEQALKMAILNRKNAYAYRTEHGAYVGDLFMSLIHSCRLNGVNPFRYLTVLQENSSDLFKNSSLWMPWNFEDRLAELAEKLAA